MLVVLGCGGSQEAAPPPAPPPEPPPAPAEPTPAAAVAPAEPAKPATAISAHTMSVFMRPTSVEMRKPMPLIGVPKNSATMAPIKANVALILSAPNMNGSAAGRRRASKVRV